MAIIDPATLETAIGAMIGLAALGVGLSGYKAVRSKGEWKSDNNPFRSQSWKPISNDPLFGAEEQNIEQDEAGFQAEVNDETQALYNLQIRWNEWWKGFVNAYEQGIPNSNVDTEFQQGTRNFLNQLKKTEEFLQQEGAGESVLRSEFNRLQSLLQSKGADKPLRKTLDKLGKSLTEIEKKEKNIFEMIVAIGNLAKQGIQLLQAFFQKNTVPIKAKNTSLVDIGKKVKPIEDKIKDALKAQKELTSLLGTYTQQFQELEAQMQVTQEAE